MQLRRFFLLITFFIGGMLVSASSHESKSSEPYDPVSEIMEHVSDAHSWHFWGEGDHAAILHLPVIIFDNGLKIFSSSRFGDHGHQLAEVNGGYYKLEHGTIYKTNAEGTLNEVDGKITNVKPLDLSITKVVLQMFIAAFVLLFIAFSTKAGYKKSQIPTGIARFLEPIIIFVRDDIALQNIGHVKYRKFVPYLVTLFLFLWLLNLMGLIPAAANVTGNIAFTGILAVFTFIITQINGKKTYWSHIFDPLGKDMPFLGKTLVYIILVPVEILGIFTKPFALMIRLFANMTAGHIVVLSLVSLIFIIQSYSIAPLSIGMALFINVLEILVTALQAYIFTLLTALYIGMAVEDPHH